MDFDRFWQIVYTTSIGGEVMSRALGGRPKKSLDVDRFLDYRQKGLTYGEIAEKLGMSERSLYRRLREYRTLPVEKGTKKA